MLSISSFLDFTELPAENPVNRDFILTELTNYVAKFPTQKDAADSLEISRVFLWRILHGEKAPSAKVLEKLGYFKETRQAEFYFKDAA
jgi:hypothetical protein